MGGEGDKGLRVTSQGESHVARLAGDFHILSVAYWTLSCCSGPGAEEGGAFVASSGAEVESGYGVVLKALLDSPTHFPKGHPFIAASLILRDS